MKKIKLSSIKSRAVKKQFALNLKNARKEMKLTQEQMEEKFGLEIRYYQRIESGTYNPTIETIAYLSQCLKTPIEQLFKGT